MLAIVGALLMIPLKCGLIVPEWAESSGIAVRWHNTVVKELVRNQLTVHREQRIQRHFVHSAHSRYGYAKRTEKYQRWKNRNRGRDVKVTTFSGSKRRGDYQVSYGVGRLAADANLDLVKTGRTRREIRQGATITVGGSGNSIKGTLRMQVPIPGGTGRQIDFAAKLRLLSSQKGRRKLAAANAKTAQDTVRRTIKEIEAFAPDEIREINDACAAGYAAKLNTRRTVRKR